MKMMLLLYLCEKHFFTKRVIAGWYSNDTITVQNQYKFGTMLNEVEYSRKIVTNGIGSAQCYYWYCVVPENIHAPQQKTLWFAHPPPPRMFRSRGLWWPPSPKEFPEFLNGDLAYHPLEIQSGFGT